MIPEEHIVRKRIHFGDLARAGSTFHIFKLLHGVLLHTLKHVLGCTGCSDIVCEVIDFIIFFDRRFEKVDHLPDVSKL